MIALAVSIFATFLGCFIIVPLIFWLLPFGFFRMRNAIMSNLTNKAKSEKI